MRRRATGETAWSAWETVTVPESQPRPGDMTPFQYIAEYDVSGLEPDTFYDVEARLPGHTGTGTTRTVTRAFKTRQVPQTLVWEAEMTAEWESGSFIGYARAEGGNQQYGSISSTTFPTGDTTYIVALVGHDTTDSKVELRIDPAPSFPFTLNLKGTDFPTDQAIVNTVTASGLAGTSGPTRG